MTILIKKENEIKTTRLSLKPFSTQDIEAIVQLLTNEIITQTFMVPDFSSKQQVIDLAQKLIQFSAISDHQHLIYGIYLHQQCIGFIDDCGFDDTSIELGYVIHPDFHHQGYCSEAVSSLFPFLKAMGFQKVIAGYFEDNIASYRVMMKCGMYKTNLVKIEEYRDQKKKCYYCEIEL